MSKNKNPAIKLFGKRIQLGSSLDGDTMIACGLEPPPAAGADSGFECNSCDDKLPSSKQGNNWSNERCSTGVSMDEDQEEESSSTSSLEESKSQSNISENPKTLSNDKLCSSQDPVHREDHSDETSSNQSQAQNPPKKPDEILPCPRCNSMVTKFCYFNNYNVKQPRHFCKNCQRYWTAGGSMRNVPVGSGRRKNKNSLVSQSTPEAHVGLTYQATRSNSRVLGSESGATTLENNRGKSPPSAGLNGFMRPEMRILSPGGGSGNHGKGTPQGLIPPQVAYFPGSPWPCAWNPIPCQSGCPPPWPPFYPPASPQWVCNPPGSWNLHLLPNPSIYPDPYSPFLGKHYRDGTMLMPSASNNEEPPEEKTSSKPTISMPKTLRIVDDPIEVAGSSVWSTLGGNKDKPGSSNLGGGLFGGFHQHKDINPEGINTNAEVSHLANRANPAAFSRSLSFHEERQ